MKKYNQFLNENRQTYFEFSISLYNSDESERDQIANELTKNFDIYTYRYAITKNNIVGIGLQFFIQPNGEIYEGKVITLYRKEFESYMINSENLISADDFLKVGMNGILKYFEIKNTTDKYNL